MTVLITGGCCVLAVAVLATAWALSPHGGHHEKTPRPWAPLAGAARAARRALGTCARRLPGATITRAARRVCLLARRAPGAIRRRFAHRLTPEDTATVEWARELHHEPGPLASEPMPPPSHPETWTPRAAWLAPIDHVRAVLDAHPCDTTESIEAFIDGVKAGAQ